MPTFSLCQLQADDASEDSSIVMWVKTSSPLVFCEATFDHIVQQKIKIKTFIRYWTREVFNFGDASPAKSEIQTDASPIENFQLERENQLPKFTKVSRKIILNDK